MFLPPGCSGAGILLADEARATTRPTIDPDRPIRLLFVCSGNLCRSPMASAIADHLATARGIDVEASSAGTLGLLDRPADPRVAAVLAELGIVAPDHRSRALTADLLDEADHVLVMALDHARAVRGLRPDLGERVVLLGPLCQRQEIGDPIGTWFRFAFRRTRDDLVRAIGRFLDGLERDRFSAPRP